MPSQTRRQDSLVTDPPAAQPPTARPRGFGSNSDRADRLGLNPAVAEGEWDGSLVPSLDGFAPRASTDVDGFGIRERGQQLRTAHDPRTPYERFLDWLRAVDKSLDHWDRPENWDDRMSKRQEHQKYAVDVHGGETSGNKTIASQADDETVFIGSIGVDEIKAMVDAIPGGREAGELNEILQKIKKGDMEGVKELVEGVIERVEAIVEANEDEGEGGEGEEEEQDNEESEEVTTTSTTSEGTDSVTANGTPSPVVTGFDQWAVDKKGKVDNGPSTTVTATDTKGTGTTTQKMPKDDRLSLLQRPGLISENQISGNALTAEGAIAIWTYKDGTRIVARNHLVEENGKVVTIVTTILHTFKPGDPIPHGMAGL